MSKGVSPMMGIVETVSLRKVFLKFCVPKPTVQEELL